MSERRHRLYKHEIPEIVVALRLYLWNLVEIREEKEKAEIAFRALYRLTYNKPGRPRYPEFSWPFLYHYIAYHMKKQERAP